MKNIFILLFAILTAGLSAQEDCSTYYDFSEGRVWTVGNFNKKGKLQSTVKYSVTKVTRSDNVLSARLETELRDEDGEVLSNAEYDVYCEDGIFKVDLTALLSPDIFKGFNDMEMEIEGAVLTIPSDLEPGMELDDANTEIKVTSSGIPIMTTKVELTDRKVEGFEELELEVGTFECAVVTGKQMIKAGFMKRPMTTRDYIAKGFGVVRSESYDKKGRLDGYTQLIP